VPGASLLLLWLAAVPLAFGLVSISELFPTVPPGVVDVRRLPRAVSTPGGSAEAAAERREGGLEGNGGVDSVLGATELR